MKTPKNPFNSRIPLSGLIFSMVLLAAPKGMTPVIASAETVPLQPFALQVRQIENALDYLGEPLPLPEQQRINQALANPDEATAIRKIEQILDQHTLAIVEINPESRVKVSPGPARPGLGSCAASWPENATRSGWPRIVTIAATPRTLRSWQP